MLAARVKKDGLKALWAFALTLICFSALMTDYSALVTDVCSLRGTLPLRIFVFVVLYACIRFIAPKAIPKKQSVRFSVAGLFFGIAETVGLVAHYSENLSFFTKAGMRSVVLFIADLAGFAVIYMFVLKAVCLLTGRESAAEGTCPKKHFWVRLAAILLMWLPWTIVFYPGCVTWDMYAQLCNFFYRRGGGAAPVCSTVLIGLCAKVGFKLGNDRLGIFIYTLIQTGVLATAFASVLDDAYRFRVPKRVRVALLLFMGLFPVFPAYGVIVIKDTLFSGFFVLFLAKLALYLFNGEPSARDAVMLAVAAAGVSVFRNSSIWIVVAVATLVAAFSLKNKAFRKLLIPLGSALAIGVIALNVFSKFGYERKGEKLSVPFQQVARIAAVHGDELSDEERSVIDCVLDYETIVKEYEPLLSDPVKCTYKINGSKHEQEKLDAFMKLWLKLVCRYPLTALEAFVGNTYGYYAITPPTRTISNNANNGPCLFLENSPDRAAEFPEWDFSLLPGLERVREGFRSFVKGLEKVPVIELLIDCGFWFWVIIGCLLLMPSGFRRETLILFLPVLLILFACLLSPVNDCFRYQFAAMASVPLLAVVLISCRAKETDEARGRGAENGTLVLMPDAVPGETAPGQSSSAPGESRATRAQRSGDSAEAFENAISPGGE